MFNDLREFLKKAEELGQVNRIEGADWNLEIGSITELQQSVPDAPMLLFDKVKSYKPGYRVVTDFLNTELLFDLASGFSLEARGLNVVQLLRDKLKNAIKPIPPVEVKAGPVMENIHTGDEVDLFEFPTPKWHDLDGGRYIGTGDMVIQEDPDEHWTNLGTYRVQVHDKNTATIFISRGKHGDIIRRKYWDKGQSCPVAVVCGGEPLLCIGAFTDLPWGYSEYDYIGRLRNQPVEVVRGKTTGLLIPASAEIVLEGELLPPGVDDRMEGPFGEYTGYYASGARNEPSFKVNCVMHRNDPIILGHPPQVGKYHLESKNIVNSAVLWNELDRHVPGIKGVWCYTEAGARDVVAISLKQMYAGHAKTAGLFAAGYNTTTAACRWIIVVDEDIDPSNTGDILWALGQRSDPEMSVDIIRGLCNNPLNPMTSPDMRSKGNFVHSRAILLACKPYDWIKEFPAAIRSNPEVLKKTKGKWGKYLYGQS
jgi:4-hydroxy-3-polyprenylbenzoate decarboxylase